MVQQLEAPADQRHTAERFADLLDIRYERDDDTGHPTAQQPPELRFDGRVVWVTGASRGLGRALAFALAGAGARVAISARSEEDLNRAAEQIEASGGTALSVTCSVDDAEQVAFAIGRIEKRFGGLGVLFTNAGISPHLEKAEHLALDAMRAVIETNVFGACSFCRAALPLLEAAEGHPSQLLAPAYLQTDLTEELLDHPDWGERMRERTPMQRFGTPAELVGSAMFPATEVLSTTKTFDVSIRKLTDRDADALAILSTELAK